MGTPLDDLKLKRTRPDLNFGQRMHILSSHPNQSQPPPRKFPENCVKRGEAMNMWKTRGSIFGTPVVLHSGFRSEFCFFQRHPNLECVIGVCESGELITEFFSRGSAHSLVQSGSLPPALTLRLVLGVCAGLEFLRAKGFPGRGRGLSSKDILVSANWEARLSQRLLISHPADSNESRGDCSGVLRVLSELLPTPLQSSHNSLAADLFNLLTIFSSKPDFDGLFRELRLLSKRDLQVTDEAVQAFVLGL